MKFSLSIIIPLVFITPSLSLAQSNRPTVTVRGVCLKSVTPDRGSVTLIARAKEKDAGSAVQKVTHLYNRLLERARGLRLKDAEYVTSNYSVQEEIDWSNNKRTSLGFSASMGLDTSTSEISRIGELIKLGSELKLEQAGNLDLYVSDAKMKEAHESCLEGATRNAKTKAESIARGAGSKIGKLISVNEEGVIPSRPPVVPMAKMARAEMSDAATAPEVTTKDTKITVQVEATFLIE